MTTSQSLAIHRLLDEAFSGVEMTPERQDLKEEMRTNLVSRVAELERSGIATPAAAARAIEELGDVRSLIDTTEPGPAWAHHRVRPKPGFLVRAVVLGAIGAAGIAALVLAATVVDMVPAAQLVAIVAAALAIGAVTADALRQETTTNYPMPAARATGYGVGVALGLVGLGAGVVYAQDFAMPWLVAGALAVVASAVVCTYLGATQTNRHKPWIVHLQAAHEEVGDRFSTDPAAAARFGLYTVTTWLIAFAGFLVLSFTVGWAWSWLALVAGFVAMILMIARMLFAPKGS